MAGHREFSLTLQGPNDVKTWKVSEAAAILLFGDVEPEPMVSQWLERVVIALIREKLVGNAAEQAQQTFEAEVTVID